MKTLWKVLAFGLILSPAFFLFACNGGSNPGDKTVIREVPNEYGGTSQGRGGEEAPDLHVLPDEDVEGQPRINQAPPAVPTTGWEEVGKITHTALYPMTDGGVQLVDEAPVLLEKNGEFLRVREFVFHGTADMVEPERFEFVNGRDVDETSLRYTREQGGVIPLSVIER